jgi:hypothetical protein
MIEAIAAAKEKIATWEAMGIHAAPAGVQLGEAANGWSFPAPRSSRNNNTLKNQIELRETYALLAIMEGLIDDE